MERVSENERELSSRGNYLVTRLNLTLHPHHTNPSTAVQEIDKHQVITNDFMQRPPRPIHYSDPATSGIQANPAILSEQHRTRRFQSQLTFELTVAVVEQLRKGHQTRRLSPVIIESGKDPELPRDSAERLVPNPRRGVLPSAENRVRPLPQCDAEDITASPEA